LATLQPKRRTSPRRALGATAVAVFVATGLFIAFDGPMRLRADVIAGTGEMPNIRLADGSLMQLNAGSAVAYDFSGRTRLVHLLRGEAYFEVAPDSQRPFVVEAMGARVTALGTAFNVRLSGDFADVTVVEHAVEVASTSLTSSAIRLQAGQEVACCADGHVGTVHSVDPAVALAWRRGQLVVDNATLESVVTEIARHFEGRIVIASTELAQRRVSGTFAVSDPDAAFELLRQSLGIEVTRLGPLVIVRG
jgi:transmembrane sensor